MTKRASAATMESDKMLQGRSAHEHHRTWEGLSAVVGGCAQNFRVLPGVRVRSPESARQTSGTIARTHLGGAAGDTGAAPSVRAVLDGAGAPRDLQRGVAVAGAGELVCAGGAPV